MFNSEGIPKSYNISYVFFTTSIAMIFTQLTGVVAVLIDGIVASRYIDLEAYSGISLVNPFSSMLLALAGFFSTGCVIVCSKLVGVGKKEEANQIFSLAVYITLVFSVILIAAIILWPKTLLYMCGVPLSKYPEFTDDMLGYLKGYMFGIPFYLISQVLSPVLVMDGGKKLFAISSFVLCASDIAGDLMNAFVFHGGAFGMGAATSVSYALQFAVLLFHFARPDTYFRIVFKILPFERLKEITYNGTPALTKRLAMTLRDVFINYINIIVAVSAAAIAVKGIQKDLFQFLFCIPMGMARTLLTMVGLYYGANDKRGIEHLFSYALKLGIAISAVASVVTLFIAPYIVRIYTNDPEVTELAIFSIRWIAITLVFDMIINLFQNYLQGIGRMRETNMLSMLERFIVPVAGAYILGFLFGSKGVLASIAIGQIVVVLIMLVTHCVKMRKFPTKWSDIMLLPEDFGGKQSDNMYASIFTFDDVKRESAHTQEFCEQHDTGKRAAFLTALFVEEMAIDVLMRAKRKRTDLPCIDIRLYITDENICLTMTDLGEQFDPTAFYKLCHDDESPEKHIGIRIVMKTAKEVRYFTSFNSNNLIINIDKEK